MSRRRRKKRGKRRERQVALQGNGTNLTMGDIVYDRIQKGEIKLPAPAIPVPIRNTEDEFARAERLANEYCRRGRELNRLWFHCPKEKIKYGEDILISPAMAKALLTRNPLNRNIADGSVEKYSRDIENDRWMNTHQGIGIDIQGNMLDGQHRCEAIVEANKAAIIFVIFNCHVESRCILDMQQRRSDAQQLKFVDASCSSKTPSICRAMMRGISSIKMTYSMPEVAEFSIKYSKEAELARKMAGASQRAEVYAAFAKAGLFYGFEAIEPLGERFRSQLFQGKGDPAHSLWAWLQSVKGSKRAATGEVYRKTVTAITAFIENKEVKRLNPSNQDFFEWLPGWEISTQD